MTAVHLHVGPVKTGSTYLQNLLWAHRDDLARQGVLLPLEHANEMWPAVNDVQDGAFLRFAMPEARGAWERVTARALAFPGRSVLSHEVLGLSTEAHVDRIVGSLAPADVHVVVMARALAPTLPSLWQEQVKMADPDQPWPAFLAEQRARRAPWTDPAAIVQRWSRHVPLARVHVVTVPPRGADPAVLLTRFAEALAVDVSRWDVEASANESLDATQVELLRRLNVATADVLDRRARQRLINGVLLPHLLGARTGRRPGVPREHRHWIEEETRRRRQELRDSGVQVHGTLDDLDTPDDVWDDRPTDVPEPELLDAALRLLADVAASRDRPAAAQVPGGESS